MIQSLQNRLSVNQSSYFGVPAPYSAVRTSYNLHQLLGSVLDPAVNWKQDDPHKNQDIHSQQSFDFSCHRHEICGDPALGHPKWSLSFTLSPSRAVRNGRIQEAYHVRQDKGSDTFEADPLAPRQYIATALTSYCGEGIYSRRNSLGASYTCICVSREYHGVTAGSTSALSTTRTLSGRLRSCSFSTTSLWCLSRQCWRMELFFQQHIPSLCLPCFVCSGIRSCSFSTTSLLQLCAVLEQGAVFFSTTSRHCFSLWCGSSS